MWLAWFLTATLRAFAVHAERARRREAAATCWRARADAYAAAAERSAWDGAWYRRAFFDDGTPLGTAADDECRIDAIAQSWAVLSGAGDPERARAAMQSVNEQLVREDARLLLLLTPPFDRSAHDPGYIKGYLPGVRENGAQYTHAALWAVLAMARLGDGDRAGELMRMLNPLTRARTPADARRTRSSRTSSPPTCTPRRAMTAAADGPGTPARRAGATAWRWKGCFGFEKRAIAFASTRAFRRRGRDSRSSIDTARARTRSTFRIRRAFREALLSVIR